MEICGFKHDFSNICHGRIVAGRHVEADVGQLAT